MGKDFSVRMKDEKEGFVLLSEGEHDFIIKEVELIDEEKSKSGKPYFSWTLFELDEQVSLKVNTTLIKGKRWLLKQLLEACGIVADDNDPDKRYEFDREEVVGKVIKGVIQHRDNTWTNKLGEEITSKKGEVNRIMKSERVEEEDEIPF